MLSKLFRNNTSRKVGLPPGSVLYTGSKSAEEPVQLEVFRYNTEGLQEIEPKDYQNLHELKKEGSTFWLNVEGIHRPEMVESICKQFGIHPLTIEDIVSPDQRPKAEEVEGYVYMVLKMMEYNTENHTIEQEQVSFLLGDGFVITFQERPGDIFGGVRQRLRAGRGRIRGRGADYLMYALVDAVVDSYFIILEQLGDYIGELEENMLVGADKESFDMVYHIKREMLALRRSTWPLREVVYKLEREGFAQITSDTRVFLRDVYDHMIQVIDTVETYRDLLSGMIDLYHSTIGSRTNEVMRVLTVISTIFIPLTFIVGVYGMNFAVMPELHWRYGYFATWGVMGMIALLQIWYFRRKNWL